VEGKVGRSWCTKIFGSMTPRRGGRAQNEKGKLEPGRRSKEGEERGRSEQGGKSIKKRKNEWRTIIRLSCLSLRHPSNGREKKIKMGGGGKQKENGRVGGASRKKKHLTKGGREKIEEGLGEESRMTRQEEGVSFPRSRLTLIV